MLQTICMGPFKGYFLYRKKSDPVFPNSVWICVYVCVTRRRILWRERSVCSNRPTASAADSLWPPPMSCLETQSSTWPLWPRSSTSTRLSQNLRTKTGIWRVSMDDESLCHIRFELLCLCSLPLPHIASLQVRPGRRELSGTGWTPSESIHTFTISTGQYLAGCSYHFCRLLPQWRTVSVHACVCVCVSMQRSAGCHGDSPALWTDKGASGLGQQSQPTSIQESGRRPFKKGKCTCCYSTYPEQVYSLKWMRKSFSSGISFSYKQIMYVQYIQHM